MAMKIFDKGDSQYRAGKADLNTVKSLRAASQLFEVCTQFYPDGQLPFDIEEKYKYAKVKASEIFICLKEGRTPQPPGEEDEVPMPPPDTPPPPPSDTVPGVPGSSVPGAAPSHLPAAVPQPNAAASAAPTAGQPAAPRAAAPASKPTVPYTEMSRAEKHAK